MLLGIVQVGVGADFRKIIGLREEVFVRAVVRVGCLAHPGFYEVCSLDCDVEVLGAHFRFRRQDKAGGI